MKTTILGGVIFLAPVAVLAILFTRVFQFSAKFVEPIDQFVPIDRFIGVATVNILAMLFIVLLCYVAGLMAKRAFLGNRFQRLDGFLIDLIPGYAVFKGVVGSASTDQALGDLLKPVLVKFDDYEQIAFEIERNDEQSVVFLPGAPSAWSGASVIVEADRIARLNIPTHQAVRLLRTFGRGSLDARQMAHFGPMTDEPGTGTR